MSTSRARSRVGESRARARSRSFDSRAARVRIRCHRRGGASASFADRSNGGDDAKKDANVTDVRRGERQGETETNDSDALRALIDAMRERKAREKRTNGDWGSNAEADAEARGRVYLVGTGPGDPGLLTLRAYDLMRRADVVLYDRLVSNDILNLVSAEATLVYVGKRAGFHTRTQSEIHELLLAFASEGATILRLKGGDPLVFGRGGEEMDFLRENNAGVKVEIVPGVTAAAGVGSELGIPLTHRGVATSVRLLTGHLREGFSSSDSAKASDPVDFAVTAADLDTTLVVYMGLGTLPSLSEKLLASGFPSTMPAVAVERGTTVDERRVFSSIADLPEAAKACALVSPTLIIIGRTVALSPHWPYGDAVHGDVASMTFEPRWVEQRGSPRGADYDDWKVWLDVDLAGAERFGGTREIHVDAF